MQWLRIVGAVFLAFVVWNTAMDIVFVLLANRPPVAYVHNAKDPFERMGGNAQLYLQFCAGPLCTWRYANASGGTCDPYLARQISSARGKSLSGFVPWGLGYAGWRCILQNPADQAKYNIWTYGSADEWPDFPPIPKWSHDKQYLGRPELGNTALDAFGHPYVVPKQCYSLNARGVPVKSWWARLDGKCYSMDQPE